MTDEAELDIPEAVDIVDDFDVVVRNAAKREVDVRLAPFGVIIETVGGPEVIEAGAFRNMAPDSVLLMGLEHEVHLGLGQDGKVIPVRRPMGRSYAVEERADGGYASFRVAKTTSGDEFLALAEDGVIRGGSVELGRNRITRAEKRNGRRTNVVTFADVRAWSPTYHPAYAGAEVLAMRAEQEDAPVATEDTAATAAPEAPEASHGAEIVTVGRSTDELSILSAFTKTFGASMETVLDRLERIEERGRMAFDVPSAPVEDAPVKPGVWMELALKILTGERVPDQQYRALQDFITTDNAGVVPDAFSSEIIGVIDPARPFMATTRRLDTPSSGMTLVVPKIVTRPTVAKQATEKAVLDSTKSAITTENFDVQTYGGVGDLSIQLLKRSSPSFLSLFLELLAEAYAIETDDAAVSALITAINDGGPEPAAAMNPASLNLGNSFISAFNATRRPPDTIWMSTKAIGEFIDAKQTTTNAPLYPGLVASATAGGGITGTLSGLRVVHVPALDDKGAYAIVGPSRGFAWAEDGTYTLQVDVPSKAGRDVALVGMVWFAAYYPAAFSLFNVAS